MRKAIANGDGGAVPNQAHAQGDVFVETPSGGLLNDVRTEPRHQRIVITAFGSMETAISAIRTGAYDFVTKPFEMEQLAVAVERACQNRQLREEVRRLREMVTAPHTFSDIIGESVEVRRLCGLIDAAAQTDSTVLITGESGTGKELVARALHERGPRSAGPFVAMNCAAMTDSLDVNKAVRFGGELAYFEQTYVDGHDAHSCRGQLSAFYIF